MKFLGMAKANMAMAKAKLMANVIMATGGTQTRNYVMGAINALMTVLLGGGGLWLVVIGVKDVIKAMSGETKDWKGAGLGAFTGILGGALIVAAVGTVTSMFRSFGADFNLIH